MVDGERDFKYAENGDQYVGRCLFLLLILNVDLATSPPYYSTAASVAWINDMLVTQFQTLRDVTEFSLLLFMCLASLLFHSEWITQMLAMLYGQHRLVIINTDKKSELHSTNLPT
jgi:hypothetical protein